MRNTCSTLVFLSLIAFLPKTYGTSYFNGTHIWQFRLLKVEKVVGGIDLNWRSCNHYFRNRAHSKPVAAIADADRRCTEPEIRSSNAINKAYSDFRGRAISLPPLPLVHFGKFFTTGSGALNFWFQDIEEKWIDGVLGFELPRVELSSDSEDVHGCFVYGTKTKLNPPLLNSITVWQSKCHNQKHSSKFFKSMSVTGSLGFHEWQSVLLNLFDKKIPKEDTIAQATLIRPIETRRAVEMIAKYGNQCSEEILKEFKLRVGLGKSEAVIAGAIVYCPSFQDSSDKLGPSDGAATRINSKETLKKN